MAGNPYEDRSKYPDGPPAPSASTSITDKVKKLLGAKVDLRGAEQMGPPSPKLNTVPWQAPTTIDPEAQKRAEQANQFLNKQIDLKPTTTVTDKPPVPVVGANNMAVVAQPENKPLTPVAPAAAKMATAPSTPKASPVDPTKTQAGRIGSDFTNYITGEAPSAKEGAATGEVFSKVGPSPGQRMADRSGAGQSWEARVDGVAGKATSRAKPMGNGGGFVGAATDAEAARAMQDRAIQSQNADFNIAQMNRTADLQRDARAAKLGIDRGTLDRMEGRGDTPAARQAAAMQQGSSAAEPVDPFSRPTDGNGDAAGRRSQYEGLIRSANDSGLTAKQRATRLAAAEAMIAPGQEAAKLQNASAMNESDNATRDRATAAQRMNSQLDAESQAAQRQQTQRNTDIQLGLQAQGQRFNQQEASRRDERAQTESLRKGFEMGNAPSAYAERYAKANSTDKYKVDQAEVASDIKTYFESGLADPTQTSSYAKNGPVNDGEFDKAMALKKQYEKEKVKSFMGFDNLWLDDDRSFGAWLKAKKETPAS